MMRRGVLAMVYVLAIAVTGCDAVREPVDELAGAGQSSAPRPTDAARSQQSANDRPDRASASIAGSEREPEPTTTRYVFPVRPHGVSTYGRAHHDYPATDIFAPCGTAVVSPVDGTVEALNRSDRWDADVDAGDTRGGRFVSVIGADGVRYYGSHLWRVRADLRPGTPVRAGQRLGWVGRSGNARPTPCHLHFGISPPTTPDDWRVRRGVVWPWPYLDAWRAGRQRSPVGAVASWSQHRD